MTNTTYEKLQAELSQLLNTEKYKQMKSKDKDIYKQAVLACKSVVSHYKANVETEPVKHGHWIPSDKGDCIYTCSECGFIRDTYFLEEKAYCPRCGTDMQEVEK